LWYWICCICGEAGELANVYKKIKRKEWNWTGQKADLKDLIKEIADIQIYLCLLAETLGVDLEKVVEEAQKINRARYFQSGDC